MSRESYKAQAAVRESSATARDSAVRRPALQESATAQAAVRDSSLAVSCQIHSATSFVAFEKL